MASLFWVGLAASAATLVGGMFALRFRDHLHLILGFSAGTVAGVALFDLLPEAFRLGGAYHAPETVALCIALGFFGYLVLDRFILLHTHEEGVELPRGVFGALTLSAHSFLDGVAIGVGFQVSTAVGIIVAIAVLTHDFSDGINTVSLIFRNGGHRRTAWRWLIIDAVAPFLGVLSTLFFRIPVAIIGLVLAVFVGSFLYLSAGDLIPESHHRHPRALTTIMTLAGALVLWAVVRLAG